jgi:hypothetical protein
VEQDPEKGSTVLAAVGHGGKHRARNERRKQTL